MPRTRRPGPARTGAVLAVGALLAAAPAAGAAGLALLTAPAARAALAGTAGAADLLVALCGAGACLVLSALTGSVLLAARAEARDRAHRPGRPAAAAPGGTPGVPPLVRRAVALAVGLALGGAAATAASAAPRVPVPDAGWAAAAPLQPGAPASVGAPALAPEPGWAALPDAPAVPELPRAELPGGTRPADEGAQVVVQRGDSLWSLARALSGPGAAPADVLRAQEHLYALNADVIGADPDLLLPGQVLRLP
ncbi:LysM peptidoglycan-binding domain-containing protein [Kineococcus sp. SYSU DK005]|uniref:LysM peptidoglycan-binding domain-containing protein n=1 Tax=Kineococcus sp. SYSU DK005 TaxID=3383126 RepID=UPI003D7EF547